MSTEESMKGLSPLSLGLIPKDVTKKKRTYTLEQRLKRNARDRANFHRLTPEKKLEFNRGKNAKRKAKRALLKAEGKSYVTEEQRLQRNEKANERYRQLPAEVKKERSKRNWQKRKGKRVKTEEYKRKQKAYRAALPREKKVKLQIAKVKYDRTQATCHLCRITIRKKSMKYHLEHVHAPLVSLHTPLTPEERAEIKKISQLGRNTRGGIKAHKGRITSSKAHTVLFRMKNSKKDLSDASRKKSDELLAKLTKELLESHGTEGFRNYQNDAMRAGKEWESAAIDEYQEIMKFPFLEKNTGLFVHPQYAYLAATPDGYVKDNNGMSGCLEFKLIIKGITAAGYLIKPKSIRWTPGKAGKFVTEPPANAPKLQLNRNHAHFTQCMLELKSTEADYVDFVVYSKNETTGKFDLWAERIFREEFAKKWDESVPIFKEFMVEYIAPEQWKGT